MIRLYRARFSTNVERVALALAHKRLGAEPVWIEYSDRSLVEQVSGQGLVPVLDYDGSCRSRRRTGHGSRRWPP
jgi:glutathione S-transferase